MPSIAKSSAADVVVVGGGPAGSTVATFLAQAGHTVVLLEKSRFPRYQIGESTLPGMLPTLREMGVYEKVASHGFVTKPGVTWVWGKHREPWSVYFEEFGDDAHSFQVIRSEFDEILLRHAESCGVKVWEGHEVIELRRDEQGRATGVVYRDPSGTRRELGARYVAVASGLRDLRLDQANPRLYDDLLNNIALWAYWRGCGSLEAPATGNILTATAPEGWAWYIPLHDGTTSVGAVVHRDVVRAEPGKGKVAVERIYRRALDGVGEFGRLMDGAEQVSEIRSIRDWSYRRKRFWGPGYVLVGDAAGFVDPLLSTGVFLAVTGGQRAAKALDFLLRQGPDYERRTFDWYEEAYRATIADITAFVHYMYDAERTQDTYFWHAHRQVEAVDSMTARKAFVHLISGGAATEKYSGYDKFYRLMYEGLEDTEGESAEPGILPGADGSEPSAAG